MSVNKAYDDLVQRAIMEISEPLIRMIVSYDRGVNEIRTCLTTFVYDGTGRNRILRYRDGVLIFDLDEMFEPGDGDKEQAIKVKSWLNQEHIYQRLLHLVNPGRPNVGPETVGVDYEDLQSLLSLVKAVIPGKVPLSFTRIRNNVRTQMKDKTEEIISRDIDPLEKIREVERIEMLIRKCDDGSL